MQLVALKYFVAVADHGSFTAAAERLGVSASTLTRSVSTLEDNLGLTLFERSLRGVALAQGASPVLAETKRMLASLEAVTEAAGGAARGIAGDLRLGVRSPPLGEPLRSMLGRWRQDHPDVRLIVHELPDLEIFTELVARRIDVALIPSFAPWPQIVMEPLYRERRNAAASYVRQQTNCLQPGSDRFRRYAGTAKPGRSQFPGRGIQENRGDECVG